MGPCVVGQVTSRLNERFVVNLTSGSTVQVTPSQPMRERGITVEIGQWVAVLGDRIIYRWRNVADPAHADWAKMIREIPAGLYASRGCHDSEAEHYDAEVRAGLNDYIRENYFEILDRVIALSDIKPNMSVLDIGIGTGFLTERAPRGALLYGIDISPKMLDKVREKGLPVELSPGSFLSIPFPDQSFDRIVSTFAFHHLTPVEKDLGFNEMDRVTKPGGRIVIGDFMVEHSEQMGELVARFSREGRRDMLEELDDEYFTDLESAARFLTGLGYGVAWERGSLLSWIMIAKKAER